MRRPLVFSPSRSPLAALALLAAAPLSAAWRSEGPFVGTGGRRRLRSAPCRAPPSPRPRTAASSAATTAAGRGGMPGGRRPARASSGWRPTRAPPALCGWGVDQPGEPALWLSRDSGATWQRLDRDYKGGELTSLASGGLPDRFRAVEAGRDLGAVDQPALPQQRRRQNLERFPGAQAGRLRHGGRPGESADGLRRRPRRRRLHPPLAQRRRRQDLEGAGPRPRAGDLRAAGRPRQSGHRLRPQRLRQALPKRRPRRHLQSHRLAGLGHRRFVELPHPAGHRPFVGGHRGGPFRQQKRRRHLGPTPTATPAAT